MKAKKLLKCVRKNIKVKMTDEYFNANYDDMPNEFTIFQIEDSCVNLHNEEKGEVFHDIPFKAIEEFEKTIKVSKVEYEQLVSDVKDIAECIQIDLDSDNYKKMVAKKTYRKFAEKYNK